MIRLVTVEDIPVWQALSAEYDSYVLESVPDLGEWYGGNENSPAFIKYMESKIEKQEAFFLADDAEECLGIIAVSKKNNRITFFAVAHRADFLAAGNALLVHGCSILDPARPIFLCEIKSDSQWMVLHKELYKAHGFAYTGDSIENGVPVGTYERKPAEKR